MSSSKDDDVRRHVRTISRLLTNAILRQEEEEQEEQGDSSLERIHGAILLKNSNKRPTSAVFLATDKAIYYHVLLTAAENGLLGACRFLYKNLSNKTFKKKYKTKYGKDEMYGNHSPLLFAIDNGHEDVVLFFLKECDDSFNINQYVYTNHHDYDTITRTTPLLCAMRSSRGRPLKMSRLLLENGADPHQTVSSFPYSACPLFVAVESNNVDMVRLLLEYKADPNFVYEVDDYDEYYDEISDLPSCAEYLPLFLAAKRNNMELVRLLLQYGAHPNMKPSDLFDGYSQHVDPVLTDMVIMKKGIAKILSIIEVDQHGALLYTEVDMYAYLGESTALADLLEDVRKRMESKLEICRFLVKLAESDRAVEVYIQATLDQALSTAYNSGRGDGLAILLQAGVNPITAMYRLINNRGRRTNVQKCRILVQQHGVDPFLLQKFPDGGIDLYNGDDRIFGLPLSRTKSDRMYALSPFNAAGQYGLDTIFLEFFLDHWDERFAANGGKNESGDFPIHVICCDRNVSLKAIKLVVERYHPRALSTVDGEEGLFPFHFAAMWDAELDVIYHLVRKCPDAVSRFSSKARTRPTPQADAMMVRATTENENNRTNECTKDDEEDDDEEESRGL